MRELESERDSVKLSEPAQLLEEKRLKDEIDVLRKKIDTVPFIDTFDLRFKNYERRPIPSSQAVMSALGGPSGAANDGLEAEMDALASWPALASFVDELSETPPPPLTFQKDPAENPPSLTFPKAPAKGWGVASSAGRAGQEVGKGCAWFESRLRFEVRAAPRERRAVDVLEVVRELVVDRRRSGQDNQPAKSET